MNHSSLDNTSTRCGWSIDTAAVRFMGRSMRLSFGRCLGGLRYGFYPNYKGLPRP